MKVAVDAMGGDLGPAVIVEGAVASVREHGASVILVGDRSAIEREVARCRAQRLGIEIRHSSQVVGMAESPSHALRRKRDSSLRVAAELLRDGHASAIVSAGAPQLSADNRKLLHTVSMKARYALSRVPNQNEPIPVGALPYRTTKFQDPSRMLPPGIFVDPRQMLG